MRRSPRGSYGKPPETLDTIGKRIRRVRMAWKWNQARFAKAIHTNQKTLSRWELDRQEPGEPAMGALAGLFGLDIEALRTGKGFRIPHPPQMVGDLLMAESYAVDLLRLPPAVLKGLVLIDRAKETVRPISPRNVAEIIRVAQEEGRSIYLVLG